MDEYRHECAERTDEKRFNLMAADDKNVVIYYCGFFERDTALCAWKWLCAMLSLWCVANLLVIRFVDMSFVQYGQVLFYTCRLRDAIDASMDVGEEDLK